MAVRVIGKYPNLKGSIFGAFKGGKTLVPNHWLDTNIDRYYKTIREIVIPDCMAVAGEVPGYPERVQKFLTHTIPSYHDAWNFSVELLYRKVADPAHQTEQNITKMYILRAVMDLLMNLLGVLDDCTDKTERRMGREAWHTICEGGIDAAIYDGALMALFPLHVLKAHFRNDPGYIKLYEATTMGGTALMIGETLDILGQATVNPSLGDYNHCYTYKAGKIVCPATTLGLVHAGIEDEEILTRTEEVFIRIGKMLQVWDDFNECYCSNDLTLKVTSDIQRGTTTWLSSTAMKIFTSSQAKEFMECYGSTDPKKIARVQELYNEIDMPKQYVKWMAQNYKYARAQIREISHEKVREACDSYMEWLVGSDVLNVS